MSTIWPDSEVDMHMGIGGAPQGILAAAALSCGGCQMQSRLVLRNKEDRQRATAAGISDFDKKYILSDMASGDVTFAATGVTGGSLLAGVRDRQGRPVTHSLVMRSKTGTLRRIETHHGFVDLAEMGLARE
jgi:fructose-1,6-bisphosphatase II / sedoheptulose-1,7-bisphosphatase